MLADAPAPPPASQVPPASERNGPLVELMPPASGAVSRPPGAGPTHPEPARTRGSNRAHSCTRCRNRQRSASERRGVERDVGKCPSWCGKLPASCPRLSSRHCREAGIWSSRSSEVRTANLRRLLMVKRGRVPARAVLSVPCGNTSRLDRGHPGVSLRRPQHRVGTGAKRPA